MQDEKELLDFLKNWCFHKKEYTRLKENLISREYGITTSYSDAKTFSAGMSVSKVENFCISFMEAEEELNSLRQKMRLCINAYNKADLTNLEKKTISYTCKGDSLLQLSKELNMAQAKIYRIRDRGVKKMFNEIQNEV